MSDAERERLNRIAAANADQQNLRDNLAINAAKGIGAEVIELIRNHYRSEGQWLFCLDCGMRVTWVTKHSSVRHGIPIQVVSDPNRNYEGELW